MSLEHVPPHIVLPLQPSLGADKCSSAHETPFPCRGLADPHETPGRCTTDGEGSAGSSGEITPF